MAADQYCRAAVRGWAGEASDLHTEVTFTIQQGGSQMVAPMLLYCLVLDIQISKPCGLVLVLVHKSWDGTLWAIKQIETSILSQS